LRVNKISGDQCVDEVLVLLSESTQFRAPVSSRASPSPSHWSWRSTVNPGMGHGEVAGFEAWVVLNRKDFGIDTDLPLETGGIALGEKITITLAIEALKQS
jgi:hypothetical protein